MEEVSSYFERQDDEQKADPLPSSCVSKDEVSAVVLDVGSSTVRAG
jgi:hypothetical protein